MWMLLFFLISGARADDCQSVDLSAKGGTMEHVEPLEQTAQDCYAFAASYMASAFVEANSKFKKHQSTPDEVWADVVGGSKEIEDANSGRTCNALGVFRKKGSCDVKALRKYLDRSLDLEFAGTGFKLTDQQRAEASWEQSVKWFYTRGAHPYRVHGQPDPPYQTFDQQVTHVCNNLEHEMKLQKDLMPQMSEIVDAVKKNDPSILLEAITQNICEKPGNSVHFGKDLPELPGCQKFDFQEAATSSGKKTLQTPDAFKAKLHELLSAGNRAMPVGIEYCYGVVKTAPGVYITNREFRKDLNYLNTPDASENFDKGCGFHASVVIGQERRSDGKCYFEIQASEGKSCQGFHANANCDPKTGHLWVDEDLLSRNLIRLSYF